MVFHGSSASVAVSPRPSESADGNDYVSHSLTRRVYLIFTSILWRDEVVAVTCHQKPAYTWAQISIHCKPTVMRCLQAQTNVNKSVEETRRRTNRRHNKVGIKLAIASLEFGWSKRRLTENFNVNPNILFGKSKYDVKFNVNIHLLSAREGSYGSQWHIDSFRQYSGENIIFIFVGRFLPTFTLFGVARILEQWTWYRNKTVS